MWSGFFTKERLCCSRFTLMAQESPQNLLTLHLIYHVALTALLSIFFAYQLEVEPEVLSDNRKCWCRHLSFMTTPHRTKDIYIC